VIFTGPVPPDEALKFYPLFHVKILSSITEGLSQALLEAMALGIPVIATHAAGNPELITDGENGFTFRDGNVAELAAKIQTLHSDREIRQKFITNGKITALEDFSIENTIKRHEKLFNRLIQPKPYLNMNRRESLQTIGLATAAIMLPKLGCTSKTTRGIDFRFCLNTSTISGQQLGLKRNIEIAAEAGYDSLELWVRDVQAYIDDGNTLESLNRLSGMPAWK
jgi:hypothetical protein